MATGDKKVNIYNRRQLPLNMLSTYMYSYVRQLTLDITHAVYPDRGVFNAVTFSSTVNDTLTTSVITGVDDNGHLINLSTQQYIPFPNINGVIYYVGVKYSELDVPENTTGAIEISPFLGTAQYKYYEENVGEYPAPSQVIDNGDGTITMTLTMSPFTTSFAGRTARAWLVDPLSGNTGWYEDLIIQWSGIYNYVTTVGNFHQSVLAGSISTNPADYQIWVNGLTITETNISEATDYIYLGTVLGNGPLAIPTTFNTSDQNIIPQNTDLTDNLTQLAKEYYGDLYTFNDNGQRSSRGTGLITAGDTAPDLGGRRKWITTNTAPTNITALANGTIGDVRQILAKDANTTIIHNSVTLQLAGKIDFVMAYSDNITFLCIGTGPNVWTEIGRTVGGLTPTTSSTSSSTLSTSSTSSTSSSSSSFSTSTSTSSVSSSTSSTTP